MIKDEVRSQRLNRCFLSLYNNTVSEKSPVLGVKTESYSPEVKVYNSETEDAANIFVFCQLNDARSISMLTSLFDQTGSPARDQNGFIAFSQFTIVRKRFDDMFPSSAAALLTSGTFAPSSRTLPTPPTLRAAEKVTASSCCC